MATEFYYNLKTKEEGGERVYAWITNDGEFLSPKFTSREDAEIWRERNPMIRDFDRKLVFQ